MTSQDDLDKIPDYRDPRNIPESESLISKYQIPIEHFEFDYIEKCQDGRELEKIFQILKSGEEGYYPELLTCTENRLKIIKPKSKHLRSSCPVLEKKDLEKEVIEEISTDLQNFVVSANKRDKELDSRKVKNHHCDIGVRQFKNEVVDDNNKNIEKRIKSTDYKSWDKYDPDTECLKLDLEEEKLKKQALSEKCKEIEQKQKSKKKTVTFSKYATEAEALFFSEREREKGNEFFKAGDFEEALRCYTNSIQSKATIHNLNNRAVTYLKLKKYYEALDDCNNVLTLDKQNIKANMRKSEALEKLERFDEALECIEMVIQLDPNNDVAQNLVDKIRTKCCRGVKNTRMKIIDE